MQKITSKINFWNLFVGVIIGILLGVCVFSWLVPNGLQMARVYHMKRYTNMQSKNMMIKYNPNISSNPYMMENIISEKQFVEDMILHHQAAVTMAEQVLKLNPRNEIKKLAEDIISAQTTEIKMMKSWLTDWK